MARARSGFTRAPGRAKDWSGLPGIVLTTGVDATLLGGSLAFTEAATIVRCRGDVVISLDSPTDGQELSVTFGLGVISTDAFAAGAASVPDPATDVGYPWLFWKSVDLQMFLANNNQSNEASLRFAVDTKAMRKMKGFQSLAWIVQSVRVAGTPVGIVNIGQLRVLTYD